MNSTLSKVSARIDRLLDFADYALCRYGLLSAATWKDFQGRNSRKLYAGKLSRSLPQFATHFGVTPFYKSSRNIGHDVARPFPIPDGCVDIFQSEDVFEHIELTNIVAIFNEIYRILSPGSLFRLSLPDYRLDLYIARCQKSSTGEIVFDPGGGGQFIDGCVTGGGHVWFPTIEIVRDLFRDSLFGAHGTVKFLQYNDVNGIPKLDPIDYSLGYVQRTPDNDLRVSDRPRAMSIVVDAFKARLA